MRRRRVGQIDVRREQWEPHEKVTLRGLDAGDTRWVLDRSGGIISNQGTTQFLILMRGIAGWTFTNEQGFQVPWPVMKEEDWDNLASPAYQQRMASLDDLMQEDINFLSSELNKLNSPNSKEEQETFLASVLPGSQVTVTTVQSPSSTEP